jgi:hypothetical protein
MIRSVTANPTSTPTTATMPPAIELAATTRLLSDFPTSLTSTKIASNPAGTSRSPTDNGAKKPTNSSPAGRCAQEPAWPSARWNRSGERCADRKDGQVGRDEG